MRASFAGLSVAFAVLMTAACASHPETDRETHVNPDLPQTVVLDPKTASLDASPTEAAGPSEEEVLACQDLDGRLMVIDGAHQCLCGDGSVVDAGDSEAAGCHVSGAAIQDDVILGDG